MLKRIKIFTLFTLFLCSSMFGMRRTVRPWVARLAHRFVLRQKPQHFAGISRIVTAGRSSSTPRTSFRSEQSRDHQYQSKSRFKFFSKPSGVLAGLAALTTAANYAQAESEEEISFEKLFGPRPFEEQRQKYYAYLKSLPWGKVAEKYIAEFEQEEKALLKEYQVLFNSNLGHLEDNFWLSFPQYRYERANLSGSSIEPLNNGELKEVVDNLLKKFNVDLPLYIWKDVDNCAIHFRYESFLFGFVKIQVSALLFTHVYMKEQTGWSYNKNRRTMIESVVMHELQHALHQDGCTGLVERKLNIISKLGCIEKNSVKSLLEKWDKFKERRADILGTLASVEYPLAFGRDLLEFKNRCGCEIKHLSYEGGTHPSYAERDKYLKKLHAQMHEAMHQADKK